ncbi:MAG: chromate transporter [Eubacteriales bacterium]|nr:chromate transporter [Eubacteriales bacterium]
MEYLELFLSFMKIGFTSFGGMSMIPLILEEMQTHRWMSAEDLTNLVAIAEMTPGPLGINCATFAGMQTAGVPGGIIAVTGVLMPAFTLTLLVAVFFTKFRKSRLMEKIMSYVKPICIAMILAVILTLSRENYITDGKPDLIGIGIGLGMLYLIQKRKWSVPKVIGCSAGLGVILYGMIFRMPVL